MSGPLVERGTLGLLFLVRRACWLQVGVHAGTAGGVWHDAMIGPVELSLALFV